jgi:hypothetical protein
VVTTSRKHRAAGRVECRAVGRNGLKPIIRPARLGLLPNARNCSGCRARTRRSVGRRGLLLFDRDLASLRRGGIYPFYSLRASR